MIQIGSRNAQNFSLLKFLGSHNRPVLFKNGMANTIAEWLSSAEYLLSGGNEKVVLCYRGTRGFDNATRFTMDSGVIPVLRERTHLPVCADPSHPAGNRSYVEARNSVHSWNLSGSYPFHQMLHNRIYPSLFTESGCSLQTIKAALMSSQKTLQS